MPRNFRERVDAASTIKSILDYYPSTSVLRELIQNSDDAKATTQRFIADFRQHGNATVFDDALKCTRGPALLAINDSIFNEEDWNSVRTIRGSNKIADETKTGKYGLGIRSCYHLTDNIEILSNAQIAIFDPHEEFAPPHEGGISRYLPHETAPYPDQLAAFSAATSELDPLFLKSTVVRLPLRTPAEAARSRIKSIVVTSSDIRALFQSFIENELQVALLFLKHIRAIELVEITEDGNEHMVAAVAISNADDDIVTRRALKSGDIDQFESYKLDVISTIGKSPSVSTSWRVVHSVLKNSAVENSMDQRLGYRVGNRLVEDKLSSHVSLAFLCNEKSNAFEGRLFTLLPLPIPTGFPLHVHGIFALTPDRQNLRNPEELGIGMEARERLLITWNDFVFQELVPAAWVKLIHVLVGQAENIDVWLAWPPSNARVAQGRNLLDCFTKLALSYDEAIFPSMLNNELAFIKPSHLALVASLSIDQQLVRAVSLAGVAVITPPSYIYDAFSKAGFKGSQFLPFDARNLHTFLRSKVLQINALDPQDKARVLEYLISYSPDQIVDLPLIPTVSGGYISLSAPHGSLKRYVLCNGVEAELFRSCDMFLINLFDISQPSRRLLEGCSDRDLLNVTRLGPNNLKEYLQTLCRTSNPADVSVPSSSLPPLTWFTAFWSWVDSVDSYGQFLDIALTFHLLPTLDGVVRRVSEKVFLIPKGQNQLCKLLEMGGIPFLQSDVTSTRVLSLYGMIMSVDNIPLLVDFFAPELIPWTPSERLVIQEHITKCLYARDFVLNPVRSSKLRQWPIFPKRVPNMRGSGLPVTVLDAANGPLVFVNVADDFPLPVVNGVTYIDMSKSSCILSSKIDAKAASNTLQEIGIMKLAIEHISSQPEALQSALMERILPSLLALPSSTIDLLRQQKFVPVFGSSERLAPAEVIDPESSLAPLFRGERGRFPIMPYSSGRFLSIMQVAGLFCSQLTPELVEERIRYVSSAFADSGRFSKATALFDELSKNWKPSFSDILQTDLAWIPTTASTLVPRQNARDVQPKLGEHHFLFDFVLSQCPSMASTNVREALGWRSTISIGILEKQLASTLLRPNEKELPQRLSSLIRYIGKLHSEGNVQPAHIESFKQMVLEHRWIPDSTRRIVTTQHALLSPDLRIGKVFQSISSSLRDAPGVLSFLRLMGCSERPTMNSLIDALKTSESIEERRDILIELTSDNNNISDCQRNSILVPDHLNNLRHVSEVYVNDMGGRLDFVLKTQVFPAHPYISQSVAQRLGLATLSSLQLDDDDGLDIDDEDMSESLVTRIKSVLVDYDIQYSFGEFLANAADAGATEFEVLLDHKAAFSSTHILSHEMGIFQSGPALLLHNNVLFSENDFKGLRRIGEGGKRDIDGTIGKFGLGALSFYHFAEAAFILSGAYLMILDPSAAYLPKRHGQKRRCFWRRLTDIYRGYPDQLEPFRDLFGFSCEMESYPGTLIRLPLRQKKSQLSEREVTWSDCYNLLKGPYLDLSRDCTHFTHLNTIVARIRESHSTDSWLLWSISNAMIDDSAFAGPNDTAGSLIELKVKSRTGMTTEQWLAVRRLVPVSDIPVHLHPCIQALKASNGVEIALAFHLSSIQHDNFTSRDSESSTGQNFLFSGIRIPQTISFPAHVNAAFAVSSDRRSIRFDPPDSSGQRIMQSEYNLWLDRARFTAGHWWPKKARDPVSKEFITSFYSTALPKSMLPILPTVVGTLVAPADAVIAVESVADLVNRLLTELKAKNFVILRHSVTAQLPTDKIRFLSPQSLVEILRDTKVENQLQAMFSEALDPAKRVIAGLIDATLDFLLDSEDPGFGHNLLLLITKDNVLRRFDSNAPTYLSTFSFPNQLFPYNRFISTIHYPKSRDRILTSHLYKEFDTVAFLEFLRDHVGAPQAIAFHSNETIAWIDILWKYFFWLPGGSESDKLSVISEYPLFATFSKDTYVSLASCLEGRVLPDPSSAPSFDIDLVPIIHNLNIPVLKHHPMLPEDNARLKFSFKTLLDCLSSGGDTGFLSLSCDEANLLSAWIVKQMRVNLIDLSDTHLDLLARLPLWKAAKDGVIQRHSSYDLRMLPYDIELSRVILFLKRDRPIVEYSTELVNLCNRLKNRRGTMDTSSTQFSELLNLPDVLTSDDIDEYVYLLTKLIEKNASNLKAPDTRGVLRPIEEFFNSSVDLFTAAFHSSQETMFIHPLCRHLEYLLPVKTTVTFDIFQQCAQAINDDQHQGIDVVTRATVVYNYYNTVLTRQLMSNAHYWRLLDNICFIPRSRAPLERVSYDQNPYIIEHPDVVSPNVLLLDDWKYQAVAWTRRCKFNVPPSRDLKAVHPDIGVPTAVDVVAHLVVLATRIAKDHPYNSAVVRDLKATYKWLQDHNHNAAQQALRPYRSLPLFLNVKDIDSPEPWVWRCADQLMIGHAFDYAQSFKVEAFLSGFTNLLRAAGVEEIRSGYHVDENNLGDRDFNRLRTESKLLDLELCPEESIEGEIVDTMRLKAHAAFLAAKVSHIEDALTGGWSEGNQRVLSFPGTYFGARTFLDLIYTGELEDKRPDNPEDGLRFLEELLKILKVADIWNLPKLKRKIGRLITVTYDFMHPETIENIQSQAELYSAPELVLACQNWLKDNSRAMEIAGTEV
ncbi:hypothetical protein BT96DRAFT_971239 [Gymnopus androsaceus JB14]|uniref:Sacsin/Nov domain-containing protein n=1 Tax=Gymnopus androsaceus JB14 TaxID=1447944 RepID=A0A6A4IE24_9AGAR|nr:hypothetical protein BT96DRAFT_971239 [Gymnopus androsaceus JB14]